MSISVIIICLLLLIHSSLSSVNERDGVEVGVRIFNGDETDISSVPFTVFIKIRQRYRRDGVKVCGGVILDDATVLTAAHCFENSFGVQVIAGSSNPLTDKNVQRRVPSEIIVHPAYTYDSNKNTTVYDFAIIKLRTPLVFGLNVQAAVLPGNDEILTEKMGKVCGWGSTNEDGVMSRTLLCTSAHILSNTYCDTLQRKIKLSSAMICSGRSSCQGDSGSGLIYNNVVIGIVSFTLGPCNFAVPPVVYGKISAVLDFIRNNTEIANNDDTLIDFLIDLPKEDRVYFPESL